MLEMTIRSEMKGTLVPTLDLGLLHAVILGGAGVLDYAGHTQGELWLYLGNSSLESICSCT